MRRRTLFGAALACVAVWSSQGSVSHAMVRIDPVEVPFYAREVPGEKYSAWIFYRPPGCIPPGFNLRAFFDVPRVFGCEPMTMKGYAIFQNGPGIDPAPLVSRLDGRGAVPIWFLRTRAAEAVNADGVVTVAELAAHRPLRGSAHFYWEILENDGDDDATDWGFTALARGKLNGHRPFSYLTVRTMDDGPLVNRLKMR